MSFNFKDVNNCYETYYMPSKWTRKLTEEQAVPHFVSVITDESKDIDKLFKCDLNVPYGSTEKEKIDFFLPVKEENLDGLPVVVFLHGGYWIEGDRSFYHCFAKPYQNQHCIVAIVGYQLAKESDDSGPAIKVPEVERQCGKAIELINQKFPNSKLIITGHSAGAYLATALCSHSHLVPHIHSVVAISGVYDLNDLLKTSVSKALCPENLDKQNLLLRNFVLDENQKVFIFVGQDDTPMFHWQSMKFYEKMSKEKINVFFEVVKDEDHFSLTENSLLEESLITKCIFSLLQEACPNDK